MQRIRCVVFLLTLVVSAAPVHGQSALKIAAIYALTGAAADANAYALQGVRYAVEEVNRGGGVLGREIQLLVFDNQSTPIGSTLAARRAAAANVIAIVGPDWSSHALAVARVAQDQGIPMISSLSTNPEVTRIGDHIFRICFTDEFQGRIIARFAREEVKAATALVLVDVTSDYSLKLAEIFRTRFELLGGRVLLELEYKHDQPQMKEEIRQAVGAGADIIFIPGHDESGWIAKQLQDAGSSSLFLGGDGWSTPVFFRKGGAFLRRGYFTTHWSPELDNAQSRQFVQRYSTPAAPPDDNTALGYDTMMLLIDAIRRANTADRSRIRDAVAATRAYPGVTGSISFNEYGDPIKRAVLIEIKDGAAHYLRTLTP